MNFIFNFVFIMRRYTINLSKWFCDTSSGATTRAARYGSFVGGTLFSWSLAMDERSGHGDLRGLSRLSVIPYVQRRTELYCSSLYEPEPFFPTLVKRCLPDPFIAQGRLVTMRPEARQVVPRW
jgi:hypothetical protein